MLGTLHPCYLIVSYLKKQPSSLLYSLPGETAARGERRQRGAPTCGAPFHARLADCAERRRPWGGGEPVSSRTASRGAPERRACALSPSPRQPCGRALAAFAAPGPGDARLPGPRQLQVREEGLRNPCVRCSEPREGSGLPRSLQGARGPVAGAPRPRLPFLSQLSASRLRLLGSGNLCEEGAERMLSPCCGSNRM